MHREGFIKPLREKEGEGPIQFQVSLTGDLLRREAYFKS